MNLAFDLVLLLMAYLFGAIPTGLLIGLHFAKKDIRKYGSGNIGATNVWRSFGWQYGLPTFLIDVAKAALAVTWLASFSAGAIEHFPVFAGLAVMAGNFFNIYLKFKGGKGIASGFGVFLGLVPLATILSFSLFGILLWLTGYVAIGSLGAATMLVILVLVFEGISPVFWFTFGAVTIVYVKHMSNIRRLLNGTETKMLKGKL